MTIFPQIAEAKVVENLPTLTLLDNIIKTIINPLLGLMVGIALVVFLWGVVEYLRKSASDISKAQGKEHMFWGVIGLTIMISAMGIMSLISSVWTE